MGESLTVEKPRRQLLETYCCAQFMISKKHIKCKYVWVWKSVRSTVQLSTRLTAPSSCVGTHGKFVLERFCMRSVRHYKVRLWMAKGWHFGCFCSADMSEMRDTELYKRNLFRPKHIFNA